MKKQLFIFSMVLSALLMVSCATSVSYKVERPAELDLNGANSISVLPFQDMDYNGSYVFGLFWFDYTTNAQKAADYLTDRLTMDILNSNYLQVVPSQSVQAAIASKKTVPCDVYLTGYISRYETHVEPTKHTDDDGNVTYTFKRYVSCRVTYQIMDAATNRIISYKSKDMFANSSSYSHEYDLPRSYTLLESDLRSLSSKIMKEIQPYTVTVSVSLMEDKSKEKDENFKYADSLAKKGLYEQAEEKFMEIYRTSGKYEAGYNAARLMQVQGKLDDALELMTKLYNATGDKKAFNAKSQIQNEINLSNKLQSQLDAKDSKTGTK